MLAEKRHRRFRPLALAISAAVFLVLVAAIIYGMQAALRPAVAPPSTTRVGDFALLDHEGKYHQLYRYGHSRAVVLFVHGVDCNIARDSIPALKQLHEQFANRKDGFLMKLREQFSNRSDGILKILPEGVAKRADRFLQRKLREQAADRNVVFLMINANPQDDRKALQKDAQIGRAHV